MYHKPLKTVEFTPALFFGQVVPRAMAEAAAYCDHVDGSCGFKLYGEGGGAWTVYIKDRTVRYGLDADASVVLEMTVDDFAKGMSGRPQDMDTESPFFRVRGDTDLLRRFAAILSPAAGSKNTRGTARAA